LVPASDWYLLPKTFLAGLRAATGMPDDKLKQIKANPAPNKLQFVALSDFGTLNHGIYVFIEGQ
jgi:hypothetical protein